jgi:hypothetical protein
MGCQMRRDSVKKKCELNAEGQNTTTPFLVKKQTNLVIVSFIHVQLIVTQALILKFYK